MAPIQSHNESTTVCYRSPYRCLVSMGQAWKNMNTPHQAFVEVIGSRERDHMLCSIKARRPPLQSRQEKQSLRLRLENWLQLRASTSTLLKEQSTTGARPYWRLISLTFSRLLFLCFNLKTCHMQKTNFNKIHIQLKQYIITSTHVVVQIKKWEIRPGMVACTFNCRAQEAEAGGTLTEFKASLVNIVSSRIRAKQRDPVSRERGQAGQEEEEEKLLIYLCSTLLSHEEYF